MKLVRSRLVVFVLRTAYQLLRVQWRVTRPIFVGVRMLLVRDSQVLLVRHTYQDYWYFPGGAVKKGEMSLAAAKREAHEEAGAICLTEPTLLGVYCSFAEGKSDHIMTFVCTDFTLEQRLDRWEIADCRFFPLDKLPSDLSPACARRLTEYLAGAGPHAGEW